MRSLIVVAAVLMQSGAEKELERLKEVVSKADTAAAKVAAADQYMAAGPKFPKDRPKFVEAGMALYQEAWPSLEDAPKAKLRQKLQLIAGYRDDWEKRGRGLPLPDGWTGFTESTGSYVDLVLFRTGKKAARLATWIDPNARNSWMTTTKFRVQPGKEYKLTGFVFSDRAGAPAELQVRFYDDANKTIGQYGPTVDGDLPVWKAYTATKAAPDGAVWGDVCMWSTLKSGAFWLDDLSVLCDGKECLRNGGFEK